MGGKTAREPLCRKDFSLTRKVISATSAEMGRQN
jgi:hypothetical protein